MTRCSAGSRPIRSVLGTHRLRPLCAIARCDLRRA
jgi:hypothetical protein